MRDNLCWQKCAGYRRIGRFFEALVDQYTTAILYQLPPAKGSDLNAAASIVEATFMAPQKRKKLISEHLKRAYEAFSTDNQATHAWDEDLGERWPALADFLCASVGPGGEYRQGAAITLFARDGSFKLCLKDKQLKITIWSEGDSVKAAIDGLEAQLLKPGAAS